MWDSTCWHIAHRIDALDGLCSSPLFSGPPNPSPSHNDGALSTSSVLGFPGVSHIMPPTLCPWGSEGAVGP